MGVRKTAEKPAEILHILQASSCQIHQVEYLGKTVHQPCAYLRTRSFFPAEPPAAIVTIVAISFYRDDFYVNNACPSMDCVDNFLCSVARGFRSKKLHKIKTEEQRRRK